MRTFKLHAKTTLLSSLLMVTMLIAALAITSAAIANIERTDDQTLTEIQARDLAQHISDIGSRDPETLTRAANLIKGSRLNIMSVRVWQLSNGDFVEQAAANGSTPATPIPDDMKNVLRSGTNPTTANSNESLYRAFAIIFAKGQPSGAVEIVQHFDSIGAVAFREQLNVYEIIGIAMAIGSLALLMRFA